MGLVTKAIQDLVRDRTAARGKQSIDSTLGIAHKPAGVRLISVNASHSSGFEEVPGTQYATRPLPWAVQPPSSDVSIYGRRDGELVTRERGKQD
jgi:hypothetical protein